jgi:adenylate kinase family enzyme
MRRIMVIGCSGSGKSTLARRMAERLGLPLIHLDRHYWKPGWVQSREGEWRSVVTELAARPEWIMDGNYSGTFDIRVPRAEGIVFLDLPRWRCMLRILRRIVCGYGRSRGDVAEGCPERFDWSFLKFAWECPARSRPKTLLMLHTLRADQIRVVLRSPAEVRAFEAGLPDSLKSTPVPEIA